MGRGRCRELEVAVGGGARCQVLLWGGGQMTPCRVLGKDSACHFPVSERNMSLCSLGKW